MAYVSSLKFKENSQTILIFFLNAKYLFIHLYLRVPYTSILGEIWRKWDLEIFDSFIATPEGCSG